MSVAPSPAVALDNQFARELADLALPWRAREVPEPQLLVLNEPLARELGFDPAWLRRQDGRKLMVGNLVPAASTPVAQAYAGHQFGSYAPRLGDGRALLLGEITAEDGHVYDLHLKGSGRTPFARAGDGLAAVGPMLREYVISEAMYALGVPTTRSLAVSATGSTVRRETLLPGAVLTRVASSHLRVGSFQYAAATGDIDLLRRLADHAIMRHHPAAAEAEHPHRALFDEVVAAQARLVAQWMLVGFIHGVMNTDNMTISGETIDYGPCAFLDTFDPSTVYSSIDRGGRYAYANQPLAAEWNLARLAEALLPLFHADTKEAVAIAVTSLETFGPQYSAAWSAGMRSKLGLANDVPESAVAPLVEELLTLLEDKHLDYTSFFHSLTRAAGAPPQFVALAALDAWRQRWHVLSPDAAQLSRANPVYIPRNHLVEEALDAATSGDLDPLQRLLHAITRPYDERPDLERYAGPAPEGSDPYRTFCGT